MIHLEKEIREINSLVGHTSLHRLRSNTGNLFAKLEYQSLMGSIKDRPAAFMLQKAIEKKLITTGSIIIESTSGNFGIALAGICRKLQLRFIPVIDPNISSEKESFLRMLSDSVIKVTEKDETGGYLLTRIDAVKQFLDENSMAYNPNQYENEYNYISYYHTLAEEICQSMTKLDYVFVGVSSGGTVTGLSLRLKEKFRDVKIIAVDVEGSVVFNNIPMPRKISGIGASLRTAIIDKALIDDVIILSQAEIVQGCLDLLDEQTIFAGGSSGAVYAAACQYLKQERGKDITSLLIFPDRGNAYLDTIYNPAWVTRHIHQIVQEHEIPE